ncbi:hypothetical protein LTR70_010733, partial [Exophiala xenobiotica]
RYDRAGLQCSLSPTGRDAAAVHQTRQRCHAPESSSGGHTSQRPSRPDINAESL